VLDWVTLSSLGTALGTLVLAVATFASVRSANRAARAAERALLVGLRPVLLSSRQHDPSQTVGFQDSKWLHVPGGRAQAEVGDDALYLAISLRNGGNGLAVLHGWRFTPGRTANSQHGDGSPRPPIDEFHRLTRDLYVPAGDFGYWQGAFRDVNDSQYEAAREAISNRQPVTIDILYGDHEGGQRSIGRFVLTALEDREQGWLVAHSRHWNLDRPDPR
jgi:hypothetical protein